MIFIILKKILQIKKIKKAIVNYIFTFAHKVANGHKLKMKQTCGGISSAKDTHAGFSRRKIYRPPVHPLVKAYEFSKTKPNY